MPTLRYVLGCFTHTERVIHLSEPGVGKAPADCGIEKLLLATRPGVGRLGHDEGSARHAFYTTGNEDIPLPCSDCPGGIINSLQARAAKSVYSRAADFYRQSGKQHGHSSDVTVIFPCLVGAPQDNVFNALDINAGAFDEGGNDKSGQIVGPYVLESARIAAHGCADCIYNEGISGLGSRQLSVSKV